MQNRCCTTALPPIYEDFLKSGAMNHLASIFQFHDTSSSVVLQIMPLPRTIPSATIYPLLDSQKRSLITAQYRYRVEVGTEGAVWA